MFFDSVFFNTIILLGALQGFIISCLLFFSKHNKQSNRLLAFLIFFISMACLNVYLFHQSWFMNSGFCQFFVAIFPMVIAMPFGPLIYFYTRSSLDPEFKLGRKEKIQFTSVFFDLFQHLFALIYILAVISRLIRPNNQPIGQFIDEYDKYVDIPRWISMAIYITLSIRYLRTLKKKMISEKRSGNLKWIREFVAVLFVFQMVWLIHLVPYILPRFSDELIGWADWYPLYIPLAVIIYWLGIKGYLKSRPHGESAKKIAAPNGAISGELVANTIDQLKKSMGSGKLYLDPGLNLNKLAANLGISAKTISTVLNQHMNTNFNDFVNGYRVEEFKERIKQPEMNQLTIVGVALECGFNSQATFQRTFKQFTGHSPSTFREGIMETQQV